ncbi:MAG: hypothetical protein ACI8RZ_000337 [Myxococcota bacterium]|jgi:hypothetical protein
MGTARWSSGGLLLIGATAWASDTTWEQIVGERLESQARAIQWHGEQPLAMMPAIEPNASFNSESVVLSDAEGELLSLSFVRWGRDDAMETIAARQPTEGACIVGLQAAPDGSCIRTLERDHGAITEWWVGLDAGLEQGWTVNAPPPGAGPIRFETEVEGALLVEAGGDSGWLTDATGQLWQVNTVIAWDATGAPLPARIDAIDSRLVVSVDDTGASWPITVDPVYTTAATVLNGYDPGDLFGASVSDAGDINGDGYDDVIVGAYGVYSIGAAYVFEGSSAGMDVDADTSLSGNSIGDDFGWSVSGAGDINDDGYDDVIVGAPGASDGEGEAHTFAGSPTGILSTPDAVLTTSELGAAFGWSVSSAGDLDDDGYDDVIVGAPGVDGGGEVYTYHGASGGIETAISATLSDPTGNGLFGWSVSDAGDVDSDNYDDVIVGAINGAGVYIGTPLGLDTLVNTVLTGSNDFGWSVSGAGDINSDGYDDVIVGAPGGDSASSYLGAAGGVIASANTTIYGPGTGDDFGSTVSGTGDVNGDGYDDVIVGSVIGEAYVYGGGAAGLDSAANTTLTGTGGFGTSVSGAGDVNGDGYNDVIVGASGISAGTGAAYLFHGYCIDVDADSYCIYDDCDDTDATVNEESAFYADVDGDGYGDVADMVLDCTAPSGYVPDDTDCDDDEAAAYPGASEICDEIDNDCDGVVDEGALITFYADSDGDGFGDDAISVEDCTPPPGYTDQGNDCDDDEAASNPDAEEVCDRIDNDCDGEIDEDVQSTWHPDTDGDGFGGVANTVDACDQPSGYVADATDCDDDEAGTYPEADDPPGDGVDSNCDGTDPIRWVQGGASCATATGNVRWMGLLMLMLLLRRRTER